MSETVKTHWTAEQTADPDAENDRWAELRKLLRSGAEVRTDAGREALRRAAERGQPEILRELLDRLLRC